MSTYTGTIIEESLADTSILQDVHVTKTVIEEVTESHQTPWTKQWTLHTFETHESDAPMIAERISHALDSHHAWYADFKNEIMHYIVFRDTVFCIDRSDRHAYETMRAHGLTLGIPAYQLPNYQDLPQDMLARFLQAANRSTYANAAAAKALSTRKGSSDYHFELDDLIYHDTYFGNRDFIGEEIVYRNDRPLWGMNYYGVITDERFDEATVDAFLREALMQEYESTIPVRGPNSFVKGDWEYRLEINGDLARIIGTERILCKGTEVRICHLHGGYIQ